MALKFRNGAKHHSSPIGQLIEKATDGSTQSTENWMLFMEICDTINASEDGPKDAVKVMRKRFALKQQATTALTLKLLEVCVKNCGKRFHVHIATKEFIQELIKIISPKYNPSVELQNQVLGLIQSWAYAFQSSPELKEVSKQYQELKAKGIEFPTLDTELASQVHIPDKSTGPAAGAHISQVPIPQAGRTLSSPMSPTGQLQMAQHGSPASQGVQMGSDYQPRHSVEQQAAKLRSELGTVQRNCRVFGELLTEMSSGQENPSDLELLEDLNVVCHQMQQRIVELLERTQIEQITDELLTVNDELNNVFLRYERFQRIRAGRCAVPQNLPVVATPTDAFTHVSQQPTTAESTAGGSYQPAGRPMYQPTLPAPRQDVAVAKLIDFDADSDTTATTTTTTLASLSLDGSNTTNPMWLTGNQPAVTKPADREADIAEMEKWLQTDSLQNNPNPTRDGATTESSEFDIFLSQRAHEAELLPNVTEGGASGGQRSKCQPTSELFTL
jgi:hypothetical protein